MLDFLKNIPAQYIYGGYCVRRSLSVMTSVIDNKVVYDVFNFSYVDNYLSYFILMEDGTYKNVEQKVNVPVVSATDLLSKHLFRGVYCDTSQYDAPDKEQIIGVFGVRPIEEIFKQIDEMEKENGSREMKVGALIGAKNAYTGIEVSTIINRFNKNLNWDKGVITVPALKKDANDTYESAIGDEMDFFDFMSDKSSDQIIRDLKKLDDSLDGVGNKK